MTTDSNLRLILGELDQLESREREIVSQLVGDLEGPPISWAIIFQGMANQWSKLESLRKDRFASVRREQFQRLAFSMDTLNQIDWMRTSLSRGDEESALVAALQLVADRSPEPENKWEKQRRATSEGGLSRRALYARRDAEIRRRAEELRKRGLSNRSISKELARDFGLGSESILPLKLFETAGLICP